MHVSILEATTGVELKLGVPFKVPKVARHRYRKGPEKGPF